MSIKCKNCGQQIAATDSECWHCGQWLQPTASTLAASEPDDASPTVGTVLRYVGLTAVSLLLLIFTTRAIGQAPLLQFGSGNTPIVGWQTFTDAQFQFSLDVPETWQRIELEDAGSTIPLVQTLEQRLGNLVADGRLRLFSAEMQTATNTEPSFVLIGSSQRFTQLSPTQFLTYAQQEAPTNLEVLDDALTTENPGPARAQLRYNLTVANGRYRCLEQFIPTDTVVYLVTACSQADQFIPQQDTFETILRSFQPLES